MKDTKDIQNRKYLQKMKKHKKIRRRVFAVFFLLLIISVTIGCVALSSICTVSSVVVEGQSHYSIETYTKYSEGIIGNNAFKAMEYKPGSMFRLRYIDIENEIKKLPYIKDVRVEFLPFQKVKIKAVEREPIAIIFQSENNYLMDIEGFVLEEYNRDIEKREFFLLKGIEVKKELVGKYISTNYKENYKLAMDTCEALLKYGKENNVLIKNKIDYIDATEAKNIKIIVDGTYTVELGNSDNMDYKLLFLFTTINEKLQEGEKGTLKYDVENKSFGFVPSTNLH